MSNSPIITLTTDFGTASPYVAVMKGVILSLNPDASIIDLSHAIPAQNLHHANYFIETTISYFPPSTIHICVIDPGVGSDRVPIFIETAEQRLLGPDNGIFTGVIRKAGKSASVRRIANTRYWRPSVSQTFHGRDVFAPVAAHLSNGIDPASVGPLHENPVELPLCSAVTFEDRWRGVVQFVDDFGNLITNIPSARLKTLPFSISFPGVAEIHIRWVRTYSDAPTGELVCLFSSEGYVEIAEVNGNAAKRLGVAAGTVVDLESKSGDGG